MKIANIIRNPRGALKHLALALAAGVVAAAPSTAAPPVTTGLVLALDASEISGLSDGDQVNTWADSSGLANDAIRQNGSPIYKTSQINGLPTVRFSSTDGGAGDYLRFNRISTIRSVFWVVKENAGTSNGPFLLGDQDSYDFHRESDNGPLWAGYASENIRNGTTKLMGTGIDGTSTSLPSGSFQLISLVTTGNVQANQVTQDRVYHGSWQGDIAEILIYDRALTTEEEELVGGYLTQKYDLSTTYPPLGLSVKVTVPKNGFDYLVGATIPATATVLSGTAPYDVDFLLDSGIGFVSLGTDSDSPYTTDLAGLAIGTYSIKATVTDSVSATAESAVNTFTVSNTGPTNLAAVPGDELVNLSWHQVLGATGYKVFRSSPDNSSYSEIATGITDLTYQDTGRTNGVLYYYVVKATVGATVSDPSNEVSVTPSSVDAGLSTVVGYLPEVWSDGIATSTVTVTLRNGGGLVAPGKNVTLAASGSAVVVPAAPSFVTTDSNGVATFTVTCTDPGLQEFTATAGTGAGALDITQTGKVLFKTKPDDLTVYVPTNLPSGGAVNVLKTWNSGTGWSDWSDWDGGNSYDVYNNKVLGRPNPGGQRGAMYINDTRTSPGLSSMSYFDSGLEITYIGASARIAGDAATYAEMLTWDGDVPGQPRQGFIVDAPGGSGNTGDGVRTWQMLNDSNRVENWRDTDLDGLHTMTLLRLSNGDVQTYVDGVLKYTMLGTVDPTAPLTKIAFGFEFSGNHYIQPGTIVQQVKAFTVSYTVGNPSAGNSTVVATPAAMPANGTDTSTVTVTLKDAANNRVAGKEVTLSYTGPGAVTITPSAQTTGAAGTAVFTVQPTTTTPGIYEFTATVTDPAVEITQKAILNTTLVLSQTVLDVSASGTGLAILNDGTLVEANHFGPNGIGSVTVNGVTFDTSWDHMTSGWNMGGQWTNSDGQGRVPDLTDATDFGKLMREYIWTGAGTATIGIPGLTVGHTYRLQYITSSPRGGNISVEGSASVPLSPTSQPDSVYPRVFVFTWVATDTTANVLVTRQGGDYGTDSEILFNGYALHDMSGGGNTGFASWAAAQSPEVTGGPYGDSDNDSIPNLVEYALNLNPAASDGAPGTLTGRVISFDKRAEAVANGDVTYEIETSPDLNNPWTTVTPDFEDGTTIYYTLPAGEEAIFGRLKVTIPSLEN